MELGNNEKKKKENKIRQRRVKKKRETKDLQILQERHKSEKKD